MDVSAVVQATQSQATAANQDGDDSLAGQFAALLKHRFGHGVDGGTMLDTSAMLGMVDTQPIIATPVASQTQSVLPTVIDQSDAPVAPTDDAPTGNNNQASAGQTQSNAGNANFSAPAPRASRDDGNSQTGNSTGPASNAQTSAAPTAGNAAPTSTNNTGEDATTEAVASILNTAIQLVQPTQTGTPITFDLVTKTVAPQQTQTGQAQNASGPVAAAAKSAAAQTSQQAQVQASADDENESAGTKWQLNFLSSAASTPQVAQQAASLSKLTGQTQTSVSVQSTSGSSVSAPSASSLVPQVVLAISNFFEQSDQGSGGGTGNSQTGSQQTSDGTDDSATAVDPASLLLAQDTQALLAMSTMMQSMAQELSAPEAQASIQGVGAAAATAADAGATSQLPTQPSLPTQATAAAAESPDFANQMQETEQTEAPQKPAQISLPGAIDQIKMQIEKGLAQGSTTIKVSLTPENMGRIDVKLEVQDGSVKATITADRPETLAVLKGDQAGMVQALQDAGLQADSTSLSFQLRGDQQRQFAQTGRQGRGQNGSGNGANDDPSVDAISGVSSANSAAGASGVDISV